MPGSQGKPVIGARRIATIKEKNIFMMSPVSGPWLVVIVKTTLTVHYSRKMTLRQLSESGLGIGRMTSSFLDAESA